jgi:hypothetical protein
LLFLILKKEEGQTSNSESEEVAMKKRLLALVVVIACLGCDTAKVVGPTSDGSFVRLPSIANVAITLDFETGAVTVVNRNDRGVGVRIERVNGPGIVFSDAWIGKNDASAHVSGFSHGWRLKVTVVIYHSWVEAISAVIEALGENFLNGLQDIWVDDQVEQIVIIQ